MTQDTKDSKYCDLLGFLNLQGMPPIADSSISTYVKLIHVTSAPPFRKDKLGHELPLTTDFVLDSHYSFRETVESQSFLKSIFTTQDLDDLGDYQTGVVYGIQHAPEDAHLVNLHKLYSAGIRVVTPCYQGINKYGGGFLHPDSRLSSLGAELIHCLCEVGFIIDVAHCGHRTALDILDILQLLSYKKIIASHTGLYEIYENPRNINSQIAKKIANLGGLIGVYGLTFGLSDSQGEYSYAIDDIAVMMSHLAAISIELGDDNTGIENLDNVCFGTDGIYKHLDFNEWQSNVLRMISLIDPDKKLGARFPDLPFALNSISKLQIIADKLSSSITFPEEWNAKNRIMRENIWSFFKSAL